VPADVVPADVVVAAGRQAVLTFSRLRAQSGTDSCFSHATAMGLRSKSRG
jgi:hypothetical protein